MARQVKKTPHAMKMPAAPKKPKKERTNPITAVQNGDGFSFRGRSMQPTADKNAALAPFGKVVWDHGEQMLLLPDEGQAKKIRQFIGCARVVRNDFLQTKKTLYTDKHISLTGSEYKKKYLPLLKEKRPYLKEADKFALESAVESVEAAYTNFFSGRAGFPKFTNRYKPNGNRYTTKYTNGNLDLIEAENGTFVKLPKIGLVRCIIPSGKTVASIMGNGGHILKATVIKDGDNYLVSLGVEHVIDKPEALKTVDARRIVSMDMGIRVFCDYGSGNGEHVHVENPRWIRKHSRRLRRFQKALSRKQYDVETHTGSRNWDKARRKVAKEQRKIANQRKDFHHKLSRKIADMCDVFICEDLNVRGMLKNRHLAKEISSIGWSQFLMFVRYKLERKGGMFLKVSRWFPSSKLCSCGYKNTELKSQRYWVCPKCHALHDRDDNAVDNLRKEGIRILTEKGIRVA